MNVLNIYKIILIVIALVLIGGTASFIKHNQDQKSGIGFIDQGKGIQDFKEDKKAKEFLNSDPLLVINSNDYTFTDGKNSNNETLEESDSSVKEIGLFNNKGFSKRYLT